MGSELEALFVAVRRNAIKIPGGQLPSDNTAAPQNNATSKLRDGELLTMGD